jgi:sodium transport system permease protein
MADPTAQPVTSSGLGRIVRLARKELTEILRDRRTVITMLVMPLLLYPLLTIGFGRFGGETKSIYMLGFSSKQDQTVIVDYLRRGMSAQSGQAQSSSAVPDTRFKTVTDMDAAVRSGEIDVGIRRRAATEGARCCALSRNWPRPRTPTFSATR